MHSKSKKQYLTNIGNIRALAIVLVVLRHSIILYDDSWGLYATANSVPLLYSINIVLEVISMPLFFSLSGFLFAFSERRQTTAAAFLRKKIFRMLIPYLVIASVWMLPIRMIIRYPGYIGMKPQDFFIKMFSVSDMGHLWFLPALFFVFVIAKAVTVCFHKVLKDTYTDLGLLVFSLGIYFIRNRLGLTYLPLLNAFNYLIWFALGYFLFFRQAIVSRIYQFKPIKPVMILCNIGLFVLFLKKGSASAIMLLVLKAITVTNFFELMPSKTNKLMKAIDKNSFGIYLFHSPLIYITAALVPNLNPFIIVTVNFFLFGCIAYLLTELLRKTPMKFLIGE